MPSARPTSENALAGAACLHDVAFMKKGSPLVVFSDLDGTLLDHETYSFAAARPALSRLKRLGLPVILASSKTAPELSQLQRAMGLSHHPAIVENGAGVIGWDTETTGAAEYTMLRQKLEQLPQDLRAGFTGFGDMTDDDVAKITGLPLAQATFARSRQFSEPGVWRGSDAQRRDFLAALANQGLHAREGGRFLTLSFGRTKKDRMREIAALFAAERTAALGDAPNDVEMLENADYGFVIGNPHRSPLPPLAGEASGRITRTMLPGPEGWNAAVNDLLDRLKLDEEARTRG